MGGNDCADDLPSVELAVGTCSVGRYPSPRSNRGIPRPPSTPAGVVVYVALEQWQVVEAVTINSSDRLFVEGICAVDAETKSMIVFATSIQAEPLAAKKPQKTKSNVGTET